MSLQPRTSCIAAAPAVTAVVLCLFWASAATAENEVAGSLIMFNDNGAWSWFEDERAIVDPTAGEAGKIIVSSVADQLGTGGAYRNGDVEVASLDLASGHVERFTLSDQLQADDHNSAALWRRPDGHYVASYSKHGSDQLTRWRVSTNPGEISDWQSEQTLAHGAGATYSNLHYLPGDDGGSGRLYNFVRSRNFDPNVLTSADWGSTFSYRGKLLTEGGTGDRPYLRYFSDGQKIHFIATERHPRNYDNSIYHGYVQDGQLFSSSGQLLDGDLFDSSAVPPDALTPVFTSGTVFGGVPMQRAWTVDVAIDDAGLPYVAFQARADDSDSDHRFFYGRFDGASWTVHELAKAGGYLYSPENDYTGLVALDPHDPNRLFISTNVDPRTQGDLAHYEIFQGITADAGASWTWQPITFNSTVDNLRPIVPEWDGQNTALLWMRGEYFTYTNYDLNIVGLTSFGPLKGRVFGDLDFDDDVDEHDAALYLGGLHADLSDLMEDESYKRGDLNGDLVNDYQDFRLFRHAYNMSQGAGAFERLGHSVPEPGVCALIVIAGAGAMMGRAPGRPRFGSALGGTADD